MEESKKNKIAEIAESFNNIEAVYLFGSQAEKRANENSDIDIGILLKEDTSKKIKVELYKEFVKAGLDKIDLVILNRASYLLAFEVVKNNNLIYKKENFDAASYQSLVIRKFLDFKYYLNINQESFKERILNG
ncbi:MAG: type VII toxin-antitoxin system MntA family adenylyltransferase antitoxin [Bacillota bacterium]